MSFQDLPQALDPGAALAPRTPEQTKFPDEKLEDLVALGLVLNDVSFAEQFVNSKARPQEWNDLDNLYRGKNSTSNNWQNGKARANLSMPLILEVVESLLPQVFLGFFSDKRPFILTAKGTTSQPAARAAEKVLEWAVKQSGFKEEIRKILKSCLIYGMGIGKWGWKIETEQQKKYARGTAGDEKGNVVSTTEEQTKSVPTFEWCELGNLLVDAALRSHDIRGAKFVAQQKFITANELDELRDDDTYKNVPSREQLKMILASKSESAVDSMSASKVETFRQNQAERQDNETSADPLQQPLEILEYWTEDRVIVVLQRKIILRNDPNEFGKLPFVSCAFIDVLKAFYGLGIGALLTGEQQLQTGVANHWVDTLSLQLSPAFRRIKGTGPTTQDIQVSPGKVINDEGLEPLQVPSVTDEALQALQNSDSRARRRVGANFGPDMPNQAMRTAEGVQEFTAGIQVRSQYFIELFGDMVFIPTLEAFIGMAKDNLAPEQLDDILTEAEGHAFDDDHLSIYNGSYSLEVLASTKLAAKRAMVSMIPTLMQLFSAAPVQQALVVQNKKLDLAEFLEQAIDLAGWDAPGLIVEMTPEDQQRAQQMNPQAIKGQMDMALEDKKHQNATDLEQTKGDVRGGIQVVKHVLDQSGAHDQLARDLAAPQQPLATRPAE